MYFHPIERRFEDMGKDFHRKDGRGAENVARRYTLIFQISISKCCVLHAARRLDAGENILNVNNLTEREKRKSIKHSTTI